MLRLPLLIGAVWAGMLLGTLRAADEAEEQFNFATGLLIKNEHVLAADEFQALLAKHPQFKQADVARYRLGEARQKAGDTAAAQAAFEQLLRDHPRSERAPQAHYWLAQLLAPKDPSAAAGHYAEVVKNWPANPLAEAAAYGVAEMRFKAGDWAAAVAACDELLRNYPASTHAAHALYTRGWAQAQAEQWAEAHASFESFIKQHPAHALVPECRGKSAECLHRLGRRDEALAAFTALAGLEGQVGRDARVGRAYVLFEQKRMPAAAAAFLEAAQALTNDTRRPACLLNAGHAWIAATNYPSAIAALQRLRQEHAGDTLAPSAAYWEAFARLKAGETEAATAALAALQQEAALQATLGVELRVTLAEAHLARKQFAAAAAAYAAAAKLDPKHSLAAEAAAGEVYAWERGGDFAAAEKAAAAFLTAFPGSDRLPAMRFAVGEYRFRRERYAEAAAAFDEFLKALPDHTLAPDARYKLGWCARHAKRPQEARAHFEEVVKRHPASPLAAESALRAAQAAEALGDTRGALDNYAAAVKLGGDGEFAQQALLAQAALKLASRDAPAALALAESFSVRFPRSKLLPFAHLYRGEALLQQEQFEQALKAYEAVGTADAAAAADALFGTAWCRRRLGQPAAAALLFDQVAAGRGARAGEAAFLAARSREEAGDFAAARAGYRSVAQAGEAQPSERRDEAAYRLALCAWRAKDLPAAAADYGATLTAQPEGPFAAQALYDLAWVQREQGKGADAEARFRELLQRFPRHALVADVQFRLGEMAYERNDFAAAATAYAEALKTPDLDFADKVGYKLGWAYERLGRAADAIAAYAMLAARTPASELAPEARFRQARLLHAAARHDEALAVLAVPVTGSFEEQATLLAAECHRAVARHREAIETYGRLLAKWPQGECHVAAQLGRGHSCRAAGAFKDALEAYAAVIAATDTEEAAQAVLGQGYVYFAQENWTEAAKAFLKVDILYGYESLKPEALDMLAKTWEKAGDAVKAARYRTERAQRYPEARKQP